MENTKDELIKTYEEYVGLLGEELRELAVLAMVHGWQSKMLKQGAEYRNKIAELKLKLK